MKKTPSTTITRENLLKAAGTSGLAALLLPILTDSAGADVPLNLTYTDDPYPTLIGTHHKAGGANDVTYVIITSGNDPAPVQHVDWSWWMPFDLKATATGGAFVGGQDENGTGHGKGHNAKPPRGLNKSLHVLIGGTGTAPTIFYRSGSRPVSKKVQPVKKH